MFCTESLELIPVQNCLFPERCDWDEVACTTNAVCYPPPDEDSFKCQTTGSLPDPFDCQKYHFCFNDGSSLVGVRLNCSGNLAYDPLTTMCDYTTEDRVCTEGPIDKCRRPGQAGPQIENPNIFYVCIQEAGNVLMPWLFRCNPTEIYENGRCGPKPTTTTEEPTTTTEEPTTTTEEPTTTTEQVTSTATTTTTPTTTTPTTTTPTATSNTEEQTTGEYTTDVSASE